MVPSALQLMCYPGCSAISVCSNPESIDAASRQVQPCCPAYSTTTSLDPAFSQSRQSCCNLVISSSSFFVAILYPGIGRLE